jgi:cysteine-rich repeat protein
MWRYLPVFAALACLTPLACFRELTEIACEGPHPPAVCVSGSVTTNATTTDETTTSSASTSSTASTGGSSTGTSGEATTSDPTTDASSSSTGPVAYCGDGEVQPGPPLFEECDDGLADDECNLLCKRNRLIFVASLPGWNAGDLLGLKGADNYCVSRAGQAGLPQAIKFKAFLSDSQTDVTDRLFHAEGRYVLVDGTVVADDWDALLTQPLQHPINMTELGEELINGVWTGTEYGTGKLVPGADNCEDWTSNSPTELAYYGDSNSVDSNWVYSVFLNPESCLSAFSIYCIEQK